MDYGYSKTDCYGRGAASSIIVFVCWINSWGLACTDSQLNKYLHDIRVCESSRLVRVSCNRTILPAAPLPSSQHADERCDSFAGGSVGRTESPPSLAMVVQRSCAASRAGLSLFLRTHAGWLATCWGDWGSCAILANGNIQCTALTTRQPHTTVIQ